MENENYCMRIKQAKLIVNAHKHNFLVDDDDDDDGLNKVYLYS